MERFNRATRRRYLRAVDGKRGCDGCSECCGPALSIFDDRMAVGEPFKQCGVSCAARALNGGGCDIYDERPTPCQQFQCLWTLNHGIGIEHRPDKIGCFAAVQDVGSLDPTIPRHQIAIYESRRGAFQTEAAWAFVRAMLAGTEHSDPPPPLILIALPPAHAKCGPTRGWFHKVGMVIGRVALTLSCENESGEEFEIPRECYSVAAASE